MIAMINYNNYSLVAVAKDFKTAYRKYMAVLAMVKHQTCPLEIYPN